MEREETIKLTIENDNATICLKEICENSIYSWVVSHHVDTSEKDYNFEDIQSALQYMGVLYSESK